MAETVLQKPFLLLIEDEPTQRHLLHSQLEQQGFQVISAADGHEGLNIWREKGNIRIVLTDLALPGMDGVEVVQAIRASEQRYTYLMVLTVSDNKETLVRALAAGADDFVGKPVLREELTLRMQGALRLLRLEDQYKLVGAMTELAALRRGEATSHFQRLKQYCAILADDLRQHQPHLGLNKQMVEDISNASVLHDIGTMSIPDQLLKKRGKLTAEEYETMKRHAAHGGQVLKELHEQTGSLYLMLAYELASTHHERWDGSGYPKGLRGEEIPLAGRIMAVADAYDALRSRKPYKDPMPADYAESVISLGSGAQFDPMLVESFLRVKESLASIHEQFRDQGETW